MPTPRPNTFLIGSMKSATTYLSELLGMHPDVFMSSPREPCHFVDPAVLRRVWPQMWQRGYWRSVDRYLSLFAEAGDARIIAEGSTFYSQTPLFKRVPERILDLSPEAKFVYIMRDPVERTISHYWHRVRWWGERRQPLAAIRDDPIYLSASYYAHQLRSYLQHVPMQRIYALTFEELTADPLRHMKALYQWLAVDPAFEPVLKHATTNPTPETVEQTRGFGVLNRIRKSAIYTRLEPWLAASLRRLARRLAVRDIQPADVRTEDVEHYLRPIQLRQTAELSQLLGRGFAEWATLLATESAARTGSLPGSRLPGRERVAPDKPEDRDGKRCVAHHEVCR